MTEGLIAKRAGAPYTHTRSKDWLKFKCVAEQEFVIGGFADPAGSRRGFGALLVGYYAGVDSLRYAGKVGTGYNERTLADLRARMDGLVRATQPFTGSPVREKGAHWIPARTRGADRLHRVDPRRQASPPALPRSAYRQGSERRRPGGAGMSDETFRVGGRTMRMVCMPDKVLVPDGDITKRDLAAYYATVAPVMVPHLRSRPLSVQRFPDGIDGGGFMQKHTPPWMPGCGCTTPRWTRSVAARSTCTSATTRPRWFTWPIQQA